jgi:beta-lactamase regulating signal transducer with metallopeptidase domain/protein involved in polysaccharide export with SLBB domain
MPWLVGLWSLGVLGASLYHLGGWLLLHRFRAQAGAAPPVWQARFAALMVRMNVRRAILTVTDRLEVPIVIGALRPMVLVPLSLLNNLSPPEIEAILAHELAHVRRHDYLINLIQTAIETLFFYHPAVWWIGRQIRRERECCCDELAAETCGNRLNYARALTALEQNRIGRIPLALGALGGGKNELLARVQRLLRPRRSIRPARSWAILIPLMAGTAILAVLLSRLLLPTPERPAVKQDSRGDVEVVDQGVTGIDPEDFVPDAAVSRLASNDLVQIKVSGLADAPAELNRALRVNGNGMIRLPPLGEVSAGGLTREELEARIAAAFRQRGNQHAKVSATVLESRRRIFTIAGQVGKPGQYLIEKEGFSLVDALKQGDATLVGRVRVIRQTDDPSNPRIVEIPASRLQSADPRVNIVVRPGDFIHVSADNTPGPLSRQVPQAAAPAPPIGEYYIGGHAKRTGVYSFSGRAITLRQAIIAAGGLEDGAEVAQVMRRGLDDDAPQRIRTFANELDAKDIELIKLKSKLPETHPQVRALQDQRDALQQELDRMRQVKTQMQTVELKALFDGSAKDIALRPDDQILIGRARPATAPSSRPTAADSNAEGADLRE